MSKCILCQECQKCVRKIKGEEGYKEGIHESIAIGEKEETYRFILEGTGALKTEEILRRALKVFKKKIEDFANTI